MRTLPLFLVVLLLFCARSASADEPEAAPLPSEAPVPKLAEPTPEAEAPVAEPTPEPAVPEPPVPEPPKAAEVVVRGGRSEADRLRQSADAVTVVETRHAKQESADLGEVLARTQGISVRRSGGLGSTSGFSLNGLQDDQVRFFLDGVPLERVGFPFGISNVPVNLVERVDIYRGVVPIRLGADALGGAVDLVTDPHFTTHLGASYQVGSFGTVRATAAGRYRDEPTGLVFGGSFFLDTTRNDYPVDVSVTDASGQTYDARVKRFHDGYHGYGVRIEAGVVDRPWAKKLLLQGYLSTYDKDLQNNVVMTVPYGEVTYGETVYGATARYEQPLHDKVDLEVVANVSRRTVDFDDQGRFVYDWFGRQLREKRVGGETGTSPTHQRTRELGVFARALVSWRFAEKQTLRASTSPSFTTRDGEDLARRAAGTPDSFGADRTLFTLVSGIEHELNLLDGDRLQNIAFVKDYLYGASAEELVTTTTFASRDRHDHAFGAGDALRFRFAKGLIAKASYEYTTRLPRADEVFGNGVLVAPNLALSPESSHNANVGPRVELRKTPAGNFTADVNAFLRSSSDLIVLLGSQNGYRYDNVYGARGLGVEGSLSWLSPGRWLGLDGSITYQDIRNVSSEGTFGAFDGDRIPNRPWLFGSWGARTRVPNVGFANSSLEPFYYGRWVSSFYRAWESQGLREFKQVVDTQITHDLGVAWIVERAGVRLTSTLEVDNLTNARVFDFFGVQRPGRALFLKVTGEL